jgi:hypothetical protein
MHKLTALTSKAWDALVAQPQPTPLTGPIEVSKPGCQAVSTINPSTKASAESCATTIFNTQLTATPLPLKPDAVSTAQSLVLPTTGMEKALTPPLPTKLRAPLVQMLSP